MTRLLAIETSPEATQYISVVAAAAGDRLIRYRDMALYEDPDSFRLVARDLDGFFARLTRFARDRRPDLLLLAGGSMDRSLLAPLLDRFADLARLVLLGPLAELPAPHGSLILPDPRDAPLELLGEARPTSLLPPPTWSEPLPRLYLGCHEVLGAGVERELDQWLRTRRDALMAGAPWAVELDGFGTLEVILHLPEGMQGFHTPHSDGRHPEIRVHLAGQWSGWLPSDGFRVGRTPAPGSTPQRIAAAAWLLRALARDQDEWDLLLREWTPDPRLEFELVRTALVANLPLERLRALQGLDVDVAWVALEVGVHLLGRGLARESLEFTIAALERLTPGWQNSDVPPPAGALDLLRHGAWAAHLAGEPDTALAASARIVSHPLGRTARDLAIHGALLWASGWPRDGLGYLEDASTLDPDEDLVVRNLPALRAAIHGPPDATTGPAHATGTPSPPAPVPRGSSCIRDLPDITLVSLNRDEERRAAVAPRGLLCLGAALRQAGYSFELVDRQFAPRFQDPDDLVASLGVPAQVVGLSAMADRLPLLVRSARAIKEAWPDRILVAGGPGPTTVARGLMAVCPELDVVVIGEGEATTVELLQRLDAGGIEAAAGCPGTLVRVGGEVTLGHPRERLRDLDALPLPAYDVLDLSAYQEFPVMTSRGCPWRCGFCDVAVTWGRARVTRSLERVLDELELLARAGVERVQIEDDTFLLPRSRVERFCRDVSSRVPGLRWGCLGRADLVDHHLVETMALAGCDSLFLGLESGSDRVLEQIHKRLTADTGVAAALTAARHMAVRAYFIWGFEFETWEDFLATFDEVGYLAAHGVDSCYTQLAPFPGTPVYENRTRDLVLHMDSPYPCLFHPDSTAQDRELIQAHPEVFPFFWSMSSPKLEDKRDFVARYWRWDMRDIHPPGSRTPTRATRDP